MRPLLAAATLTLWFGGDLNLGKNGDAVLAPLATALKPAQGIINFEGPIGKGDVRNDSSAPRFLAAAGVRVAGILNNHAYDLGPDGYARTRKSLVAAGL